MPRSSTVEARRGMIDESVPRDRKRFQQGADPTTGNQVGMVEVPESGNYHNFTSNTLEHVQVPTKTLDERQRSDQEREAAMIRKYGPEGPGERLKKSIAQEGRDQLQKQQDIDGLPWEVRWKRNLIPTHEEIIADVRDRFELFEVDPIEREKSWYLHWRDRMYNVQRDRLIWPQGYTDYLDHYDENGRRRTLPTDQRWSDVSWKHLADTNYRDRMWLIESEEKRAVDHSMEGEEQLMEELMAHNDEHAQITAGINYGVIDIDPDQAMKAVAGSADPLDVARAKFKVGEYVAEQQLTMGKNATEFDPVTGLPKSEREPFPTGVTVEQAALIEGRAAIVEERMQQKAEAGLSTGHGPVAFVRAQREESAKQGTPDQPAIGAMAERSVKLLKQANEDYADIQRQRLAAAEGAAASSAIADGSNGGDHKQQLKAAGLSVNDAEEAELAAKRHRASMTLHAMRAQGQSDADGSGGGGGGVPAPGVLEETERRALDAAERLEAEAARSGKSVNQQPQSEATAAAAPPAPPKRKIVAVPPKKSGFIPVPKRPDGAEPATHADIIHEQKDEITETMPDWYREQVVDGNGPMIGVYNLTSDPLEKQPVKENYTHVRPNFDPKRSIVDDDTRMGENSFDELKFFREKQAPEIAQGVYDGLPTYRDVMEKEAAEPTAPSSEVDTRSKSEQLRDHRRETRRASRAYDPDISLPKLPWETDPLRDPNRGVKDVVLDNFDRKTVEKVFRVYKEFMQQRLVELSNLAHSNSTSDERIERFLRDAMDSVRRGHVGDHPKVDPIVTDVFKLIFEGHLKHFLSDYYSFRGGRKADSEAMKADGDDLLKRATAKSKQLGQQFVDLMQEMSAVELDQVKKNPIQKYCILCREKSHEVLGKPFVRWIQEDLGNYLETDFTQVEQIESARQAAMRTLNEAKYKSPRRIEGVKDGIRDLVVESFYHWCRASLTYHTGKIYWRFYLQFADSRFRFRAQEFFEESWEVFIAYHRTAQESGVHIPVPFSEPLYEIQDSEFVEGENGTVAETGGNFEKAEKIWAAGTTMRWYPQYDELDYLHFNERRGKYANCYDISERSLEGLQKKTHPSIHPFPERAKKFLEGAPLTQETAEHLWLRYIGDVYIEHSDFCGRSGKQQTAREHLEHGLNSYRLAIREANDRLPKTWIAPLLTKAKYLARCVDNTTDVEAHWKDVCATINAMYKLENRGPVHWNDRLYDVHWRVSLLFYSTAPVAQVLMARVQSAAAIVVEDDEMRTAIKHRADVGFVGFSKVELVANEQAEKLWREPLLAWRDKEREHTDEWHFVNALYFMFKVCPRTEAEVEKYWEQLYPTYDFMYTRTALGSRSCMRMFMDIVRRLCQVALPGTVKQKERLLVELKRIQEKLHFATVPSELNRCVSALELHLQDPSKPPYVYGSMLLDKQASGQTGRTNPLLLDNRDASSYRMLRDREAKAREGGGGGYTSGQSQAKNSLDDNPLERDAPTARDLWNETR